MKNISRRSFLRTAATAGGALLVTPYLDGSVFRGTGMEAAGYFEKEFGIDDQLCHMLLQKALSHGGDFADLFFEHSLRNWLILEDGKVNQSYGQIKLGVGIRTVKGDQVGYGYTEELNKESMLSAAATAASLVNETQRPVKKKFRTIRSQNYYPLISSFEEIPLNEKLPLVKSINEKCFNKSDLIVKVSAGFHDHIKRVMVVTSEGTKTEDLVPLSYLYALTVGEKNGKRERSYWNLGGKHDFSFYTDEVAENISTSVVDRTLNLFDAVQPPAGEMPVVLGPGVTGVLLHEAIGHGMEADFNRKKTSTYSTMLGKKVAEPFVTIVDDGTMNQQSGSLNFDDEGTPGQKTVLVENGILKSYMHDRISARYYGVNTTGNGRRESYEHYPVPRMRNTYMLAGEEDPEDIIRNVKKGIYIEDVSNGQVKIGEGDFAFFVSQGKMIENGKITAPIKDVNIMGNGPKMLKNITNVGNDLKMNQGGAGMCGKAGQGVPVSFGLPTCLVKSMTVGGTQQKGGIS